MVELPVFSISNISYIDESILGFLQEFERNSLLGNANLLFCNAHSSPDVQLGMLNKVLPLISSIYSIKLNCHKVLALLQKEYAGHEQFKRMLTSARALYTWSGLCVGFPGSHEIKICQTYRQIRIHN
jgi:hypothetical protein